MKAACTISLLALVSFAKPDEELKIVEEETKEPMFANKEEAIDYVASHTFPPGSSQPLSALYPKIANYMTTMEEINSSSLIERF